MKSESTAPLAHRIHEACQRLGVGRSKLYELIASGEISSFKVGTRTLIPESELRRFVTERTAAGAPPEAR